MFALLGPNGAGKTTAVKILSTLVPADAGDLRVGGHDLAADPQAVRAAIGVTGQFSAVDGLITGEVLNGGKIAAEGTAEGLKRLIPGGHIRLRFTDPVAYQTAAEALREVPRDDEALPLSIPGDGSQRELRSVLDRLDSVGIEADELTVRTPDLDDVFFALTGPANVPDQTKAWSSSAPSARPSVSAPRTRPSWSGWRRSGSSCSSPWH